MSRAAARRKMEKGSDTTILFVDDEPDCLNAIRRFLRRSPYRTIFADSGEKALEILALQEVAVLVSDLRMPEMDGLTLLKEVKRKYPDIIRLVLSATTDADEARKTIDDGGVYAFISKPIEPEHFRQSLQGAVEKYKTEAEH